MLEEIFLENPNGKGRILICQRADGLYVFVEEYWFVSEYEGEIISQGWSKCDTSGLYETANIARREARVLYPNWEAIV